MKKIPLLFLLISFSFSCGSESCKIDFENNSDLFYKAVNEIHSLNLKMDSKEPYFRIVNSFSKETNLIGTEVFDQIEFIECHEDGTIIFQAPNCDQESDFRDVVYFVAFSPLGRKHIERKRTIGKIKEIDKNWFLGTHINTLAN